MSGGRGTRTLTLTLTLSPASAPGCLGEPQLLGKVFSKELCSFLKEEPVILVLITN